LGQEKLLTGLTGPQRQAVTHVDGPLLVLAGPGSGKTRVITHRVAYLIQQGVRARNILAVTFTNKAAQEMRQRVAGLGVERGTTICTFHSLGARLLGEFARQVGLPRTFSIYDEPDQKATMRAVLAALDLDEQSFPAGRLLTQVSIFKNHLRTPQDVAERADEFGDKVIAQAYAAYEKQLQANAALDFDDLLMKLALLLGNEADLRDCLNDRYRYVLVDEYQDTNHCQYLITRGLALSHSNLCVTGDPDQSIYGWRGADIGNILAFEEDFPQAKVVRLEENFRSTPQVLAVAAELIERNRQRKAKRLLPSKENGPAVELLEYENEYKEALGITLKLKRLREEGFAYRQMAIFYRVNSQSRVLEEALRRRGIPYQVVRGVEFFQRREIKDMLAYLRVLVNPADQVALRRIINRPARGIGANTVKRLFELSQATGKDIWDIMAQAEQRPQLGPAAKAKVRKFVDLMNQLRGLVDAPVATAMREVFTASGLAQALAKERSDDAKENVEELINSALYYQDRTELPSLADYLQQISLISDTDAYDQEAGCVSLMTLHAAKGLEFAAVLIAGVEEGLIPHTRSANSQASLEEERRLLFVGITRAEERLTLSYARNRTVAGASQATIRSAFLRGLSDLIFSYGDQDQDEQQEHADKADDDLYAYGDEVVQFRPGQYVRHPKLGVGKIQHVIPRGAESRIVIRFLDGSRKTLVWKYAHLEMLDYPGYEDY